MGIGYPDFIRQAAFSNYSTGMLSNNHDHIGDKILEEWICLEREACMKGYDVLANPMSIRVHVKKLIRLLYYVPNTSAAEDAASLKMKDEQYGSSWCIRGGVGAFFSTVRKVDRLKLSIAKYGGLQSALSADTRKEGVLDDLNDLRGYLILWEAWWLAL